MNKIYHDVILDIKKETYAEVKVNQNDANSRVIRATIQDNGKTMTLADTLSAVLRYTKKDGNGVEAEATITDGKVEVDLKEGMLSAPGNTPATITLYENGQVLSTMVFYLIIDRSPLQDNTIVSSSEYSALDKEHKMLQDELKNAEQMVESATQSAGTATEKAAEAAASAASAATAEGTATEKAAEATTSADSAKNYAEGVTDSAKYYYEQAKRISESFSGALRPMGTVTFSSLPSIEDAAEGDMYNISNEFTTTEDFKEGSGIVSPAGSNIYKTSDGYWDILAGTPVTGVKGKKESSYRRGNVNITPANIGALPENGDSKEVITTFTSEDSTSDMDNVLPDILESGETHASIFNKLSRLVKNVRWIVKTIGTTDISSIGDGTLTGAASELNNSLASFKILSVSKSFNANITGYLEIGTSEYDYVIPVGIYCDNQTTKISTKCNSSGKANRYNITNGSTSQTIKGFWLGVKIGI